MGVHGFFCLKWISYKQGPAIKCYEKRRNLCILKRKIWIDLTTFSKKSSRKRIIHFQKETMSMSFEKYSDLSALRVKPFNMVTTSYVWSSGNTYTKLLNRKSFYLLYFLQIRDIEERDQNSKASRSYSSTRMFKFWAYK